jgi:dienelactone hydrolase
MRLLSVLTSVAILVATATIPAAYGKPQVTPVQVDIPRDDGILHGLLYKPDGNGPFAAVIAVHGCSGLIGHGGQILPRYRDWVDRLLKAGNAVLFPDSSGPGNAGSQCHVRDHKVFARRHRVADIRAAQQWLLHQPWVVHDHIGLLGWADGASAVLWAVRPQLALAAWHDDFRSAVAFYPDCRRSSRLGWSARVPTLVLTGADDLRSPGACRQMVDNARGRSALARIVVYPGVHHDVDRANASLHPPENAPAHGHGHVVINPAIRADSLKRAAAWLAR